MASRLQEGAAGGRLSVEAAHYYARIYAAARAGCLAELRRAGCGEEEAEDIFATTLERIMRKFDPAGSSYVPAQMVALLKRACYQKLIDERRHRDVLRMVPLQDASHRFEAAAESPAEAAEEREAVEMGREAISSLPERDRAIFFQRHQLELTPDEILRRNPGLSLRTYGKIIQRANARALKAFREIDSGARCAQIQGGHLRRYVAGEASEEELATVRAHLRHCRICRHRAAQMREHLHDVASSLAAVIAGEGVLHEGFLSGWTARLAEAPVRGGDALLGATRAARERLRELALKAATALPAPGGDSAAGQLAGISAAKAVSVCAAGVAAAGCLAAGVVPGLGSLDLTGPHDRHRDPPASAASPVGPAPGARTPAPVSSPGTSRTQPAKTSTSGKAIKGVSKRKPTTHSLPQARRGPSDSPAISGRQVGTEFGSEAAGAGTSLPSASARSPGGRDNSSRAGEVSNSRGAAGSAQVPSGVSGEFGL